MTLLQPMRRAALESAKERFAQVAGAAGYLDLLGLQRRSTAMLKLVNKISTEET